MYTKEQVELLITLLNTQINKTTGGLALGYSSLNKWIDNNIDKTMENLKKEIKE